MKNLKLLLATTAMLSMGAMAANAVSSDTVEVSVKLFPMTTVEVTQQPDLGVLTFHDNGSGHYEESSSWGALSVNENGRIVSSDASKAMVAKAATDGMLNVSCDVLDSSAFGANVSINASTTKLFNVRYKCVDDNTHKAKIVLSGIDGWVSSVSEFLRNGGGEATGSFTVTTVY